MDFAHLEASLSLVAAKMKAVLPVLQEVIVKQKVSRLCYVILEAIQSLDKAVASNVLLTLMLHHLDRQFVNFAIQLPDIIHYKALLCAF